eukprot:CFRG7162T1
MNYNAYPPASAPHSMPQTEGTGDDTQDRGMLKKLAVAGAVAGAGMVAYKMLKKRKRVKQYRQMPDGSTREVVVEVDADPNDPEAYDVDERGVAVDPNVRARLEWEDKQNEANLSTHQTYGSYVQPQVPQKAPAGMPNMYQQTYSQQAVQQQAYGQSYGQHQPPPYASPNGYGPATVPAMPYQTAQQYPQSHNRFGGATNSAMMPPNFN